MTEAAKGAPQDATTTTAPPVTHDHASDATDGATGATENDLTPEVRAILKKERASARAAEARAKAAEAKVQGFEDATKTEVERLTERATRAEADAKTAAHQLLRERVARRHNLPEQLTDRLRGDTEEELEADATSLLEALPAREGPRTPPTRDGATPPAAANIAPGVPRLTKAYTDAAQAAR